MDMYINDDNRFCVFAERIPLSLTKQKVPSCFIYVLFQIYIRI